jgi:hypothetical protein
MRAAFRPLYLLFLTESLVVYLKRADKSIRLACRSSPWQNGTDQQAIMPSRRPSELGSNIQVMLTDNSGFGTH